MKIVTFFQWPAMTQAVSRRSLTAEFRGGSVRVGKEVNEVAMGQVPLRALWFSPVNMIPPWLPILTYHHLGDEQQACW
jgi:hypothetical protein